MVINNTSRNMVVNNTSRLIMVLDVDTSMRLRCGSLKKPDILKGDRNIDLRQTLVPTNLGHLHSKMLKFAGAVEHKAYLETHTNKKQKLLLHAEQPRMFFDG